MRPLALLLLALSLPAADLEQITLVDGRRLIGYYDAEAGKLTVEGPPKAVLPVSAAQIVSRSPYVRAIETDPVKRDEQALIQLEAERDAALADVNRLRKFAADRTGKDAETALAQAAERADHAGRLADKIDAAKARLAANRPVPTKAAASPATGANERWEQAMREADDLRTQYINMRFTATVEWLKTQPTAPLVPPILGEDPRQSEIDARDRAVNEARKRARLAKLLRESEEVTTADQRDEWVKDVLSIASRRAKAE